MAFSSKTLWRAGTAALMFTALAACGGETGTDHAEHDSHDTHASQDLQTVAAKADEHTGHDDHDEATETHEDHDDHDEHEDHEDHDDHSDHADHDDESGHGGEAHVHGYAEMAVTVDGSEVLVSIDSPLSNFGAPEAKPTTPAETDARDSILQPLLKAADVITLNGGDCTVSDTALDTRYNADGGHGNLQIDYTYTCAAPDGLSGVTLGGFSAYAKLETIDAIYLNGDTQSVATVTPGSPTFTFD